MVKIQVDSNGKAIMLNNKALEATGGGEAEGFLVQVIDYDGTVLKSSRLNTGATFTLPNVPSHNGLVFDGWSSPVTITSNTVTVTNSDITIGPMFHTTSGLSEFDITLTTVTGLNVTLNMSGTKNWGDGTSDTLTTHTYSSVGDYTITCNGSTMTTSGSSGLFGQSYPVINYCVKNVRFGSSVTSIGTYAFYHCDSLASITIPEGVTSIGTNAFNYCCSLTSITIPEGVTSINTYAFNYCCSLKNVTIPSSVTSIGAYTFTTCNSLTNVTIPEGVTSIDDGAFEDCYSLTNVTIPSSVASMGMEVFMDCYSLKNVIISEGVTSIGNQAFYYCYSLKNVIIPSSVTNIGNESFENCYALTNVTIPEGVTSIGLEAFTSCYSLTSITIPEGVTIIDSGTFSYCYALTNVTIPEGVTSIDTYAFSGCASLTNVTIPEGVTSIGTNAFSHCDSLKNVTISSSVTSIGDNTFDHCGSVIKYDFSNHTVVPTLSNTNAFTNINQICKIRVPWNLYQEWIVATNWSTYADYIDGGTPATLNFVVTPSNSVIYVNGSQIQGTSTSCMGSTTSYIIYDSINNVVLIGQQTGIAEGATVNITADLTSYNKITLATGVTGLTVTATIDGLTFPMTEESSGNYSINVIGSGTTVDYFIYGGSNYMDASGSITTTGSDITEAVTLTPATELTFTRPNLTADGTLGGSSFAVKDVGAGTSTITYPAWRAVDNSATTYWGGNLPYSGNKIYTFYNPNALKVSELTYTYNSTSYRATAISIQGSNDNSTWEDITSTYSGSSTTYTSALTNSKYYKYYKLTFTPYSSYVRICNLAITATYKAPAS